MISTRDREGRHLSGCASHQGSAFCVKDREGKSQAPEVTDEFKATVFSRHDIDNTQRVCQHTHGLHRLVTDEMSSRNREDEREVPFLTRSYWSIAAG